MISRNLKMNGTRITGLEPAGNGLSGNRKDACGRPALFLLEEDHHLPDGHAGPPHVGDVQQPVFG
ncbi:MAG: hypothetical protein ACK5YF_08490, partial [Rhodobacterales bacterium]